jgi:predicted transposase YbfD/YdcC
MLAQVPDKRSARGKRYPIDYLLGVILLAKLSGEQKPSGITEWIRARREELAQLFQYKRFTAPSLNTIRRALGDIILASELHRQFRAFLRQAFGGQQSVLVVIDGKTLTLRGTIPKGKTRGLHLIAAYLPAEEIVLAQMPVDKKENEIVVAPKLLKRLDLKRRIVIGDAMFTQRNLSVQIKAQGGDYIWFVKENQPQLLADVSQFFVPARRAKGWFIPSLPQETVTSVQKGHGRLEKRTLILMVDATQFIDWPALAQVFKLIREVTCLRTGNHYSETVYGITSLLPAQANARQMLQWTQAEWGIENGLHYRRDKTLLEDDTRMANPKQGEIMATFNNFIVGLASKLGFSNLASAQRTFDATINRTLFNIL